MRKKKENANQRAVETGVKKKEKSLQRSDRKQQQKVFSLLFLSSDMNHSIVTTETENYFYTTVSKAT